MATGPLTLWFPEKARTQGLDVFDVVLQEWGTATTDMWPLSDASSGTGDQPGFSITPAGIVLGPRSTVDRAWVSWNTQFPFTDDDFARDIAAQLARPLTLDTPIFFSMPASNMGVLQTPQLNPAGEAMRRGLLYVFPAMQGGDVFPANTNGEFHSTLLPPSYLKANGEEQLLSASGASVFVTPRLHLQFLLRRDILPPSPKREPYMIRTQADAGSEADVEVCLFQIPTFGRKHVHITASGSEAGIVYRVGALRAISNGVSIPHIQQESTEGRKGDVTALEANEAAHFHLCDPCADYVMLYATLSAALGTTVSFTVVAYD